MKFETLIQSGDWKGEKHVPVIEAPEEVASGEALTVTVSVGKEIPHPNTTEHHIRWIKLFFKGEDEKFPFEVGTYEFNAHGEHVNGPNTGPAYSEPYAVAKIKLNKSGTLLAMSYCNIHGLWENSKEIKVK